MIIDNGDGTCSIKMPLPWKIAKPLSDEEIEILSSSCWVTDEDLQFFDYKKFAKLLEERHGIK